MDAEKQELGPLYERTEVDGKTILRYLRSPTQAELNAAAPLDYEPLTMADMQAMVSWLWEANGILKAELDAERERGRVLTEALEWYADAMNHYPGYPLSKSEEMISQVAWDGGRKARLLLYGYDQWDFVYRGERTVPPIEPTTLPTADPQERGQGQEG